MNNLKKYFFAAVLAGALYLGMVQLSSGQDLITNGDFTSFSTAPPTNGGGLQSEDPASNGGALLNNWTSTGYNFVFTNGNAGDLTIQGQDGNFSLWGPNSGSANGLTTPPGGGNVIAADGA